MKEASDEQLEVGQEPGGGISLWARTPEDAGVGCQGSMELT